MNDQTKVIPTVMQRNSTIAEELLGSRTIRASVVVGIITDPKLPPYVGD